MRGMEKIKVGVVGATGYAGCEICRIILGHPQAELKAISSVSFEGMELSQVYPSLLSVCDMVCGSQQEVVEKSDVIFAALPHGLSQELAAQCWNMGKVFIDMGADFRLADEEEYQKWYGGEYTDKALHKEAVYGLPEFFRENIRGKRLIANPGCYTTAVPLALVPAMKNNLIEAQGIIADCKSGVTGAGRKPSQGNHYPELNEGFTAYKVASHRHTPEIEQTLSGISGESVKITFVPHLLPINRGILATCYGRLKPGVTDEQLRQVYENAYKDEYFVRLLPSGQVANVKNVRYTNFCDVSLFTDRRTSTFVAISAIDNMVKGAAGQAVQNMNLCFGLDETMGLKLVPVAF